MRANGSGDDRSRDRAMQEWMCRENIKRLRDQIDAATDARQRAILLELIREQEAELARVTASPRS